MRRAADDDDAADADGDVDAVVVAGADVVVVAVDAAGAAVPGAAGAAADGVALHALWCDDLLQTLQQHDHLPHWQLAVATWSWA